MQINVSKLRGQYIYLELLKQEDVLSLRKLARDERIWDFTKTLLVNETFDAQFDKYIATAFDPRNTGMQISFVMRDAKTAAVLGMTRYYKIEPSQKRLSIGYTWYTPAYWGKVHNKECKLLLLQYAFEELRFQRVEFEVAHQNVRSQKAVAKIGGVKEAVLRKHGLHADGTVRDTVVFSIIDDEWPQTKEKLFRLIEGSQAAEKN
ncbi:GNAT family N-acetyltransferase [Flavisolibacter ginsenosidimutans]|uniref:GNAT family N-acetyltransferase n=1 Tax=Flavisolibacter ginsenosidimutans TaxID=661481 RepID=A0A5B8UKS6_9BACT|nr:GNAT family protein [Flavisolibacter ginsenosidimutans]QEC57158.1 GNAT family N-acetyltransferase [Flavisolibacter ginsenosidimutans]